MVIGRLLSCRGPSRDGRYVKKTGLSVTRRTSPVPGLVLQHIKPLLATKMANPGENGSGYELHRNHYSFFPGAGSSKRPGSIFMERYIAGICVW